MPLKKKGEGRKKDTLPRLCLVPKPHYTHRIQLYIVVVGEKADPPFPEKPPLLRRRSDSFALVLFLSHPSLLVTPPLFRVDRPLSSSSKGSLLVLLLGFTSYSTGSSEGRS